MTKAEINRIGIMGGTFDPIHHGHLITAQSVALQRNLDKILFIPCSTSPHKIDVNSTPANNRLDMVKLAIKGLNKFSVSDYEIKNKGISYTIDTIIHLKEKFNEIEFIIGYDNYLKFDTWKEPDKILELVKLVVLKRSYNNIDISSNENRFRKRAVFVETPVIDITSTEIRERVKKNLPIDFLVPESVKKYIVDNKLYK